MTLFQILHADHGISREQKDFIKAEVKKSAENGFFILQVDLPESLGTVPNAMYGPAAGDAPVSDADVIFEKRGDRPWADRMVCKAPRPCGFVQAIGIRDGDSFTLFTIYGGQLAPQHPDDPSNHDPEGSRAFWADHALATG
jgi:hypothetical protein